MGASLTLFQWSLRSDVRSVWPHVVRAGFAFFMLFSITAAYVDAFSAAGPGLKFFQSICLLNVLLISVSGISYFVSAVTEEKDSGTLALLRLAGMTPLAIVLGKSTSRLISCLMLLWIQLPFTFLAITLGGVTLQQIVAAYAALAAWMALVANMALFCSVRSQTSGRAAGLAAGILFLFFTSHTVISSGLAAAPKGFFPGWFVTAVTNVDRWQQNLSIVRRLDEILEIRGSPVNVFDVQLYSSLVVAAVLFLVSVVLFDRWSAPLESVTHGESAAVRRWTVGRCWNLPIVWKDFLFFTGGRSFFVVKFITYGIMVQGFYWFHQTIGSGTLFSGDVSWNAFVAMIAILIVEILLYASGSLFSEIRQATISSLVMLPISTPRLLGEKIVACLLATAPALFWLGVILVTDFRNLMDRTSATMVVTVITIILLSSHLTVLLSLITRWGALPLAVLITAAAFMCCPMVLWTMFSVTDAVARSHGLRIGVLLGAVVNLVWVWLFVLLPLEIEIARRWNQKAEES
jgi:hypothetical protein